MIEKKFIEAEKYIEENFEQLPLSFLSWRKVLESELLIENATDENFERIFGMSVKDLYLDYFDCEMASFYGKCWLKKICDETKLNECDAIFVLTNMVFVTSEN